MVAQVVPSLRRPVLYMPVADKQLEAVLNTHGLDCVHSSCSNFDVALFCDGPPVSPFLYGERIVNKDLPYDLARDLEDNRNYRSLPSNLPKIGIGRGAQFLNVMNGGSLWQYVNGHDRGQHMVRDLVTGSIMIMPSDHINMMIPADHAHIQMYASESSKVSSDTLSAYTDFIPAGGKMDTECCYYEESNSLCFQPVPKGTQEASAFEQLFMLCDHIMDLPNLVTFNGEI